MDEDTFEPDYDETEISDTPGTASTSQQDKVLWCNVQYYWTEWLVLCHTDNISVGYMLKSVKNGIPGRNPNHSIYVVLVSKFVTKTDEM